ncbi:MAG: 23S rRNA (adenine(2503)-C(2))-methyltransferase RlmN [Defluviitaleaceae bacterium]|nr:23S rRNA (adenine(2503)-C(2))-methyltransferase RlmN [Defluviitaleaceae bacterium]
MFDVKSATFDETATFIASLGEPAFRARQVYDWVHKKLVGSFAEMANVPKELRTKLAKHAFIQTATISEKKISKDGTIKYLNSIGNHTIIEEGEVFVESVLMRYNHGNALCISTQAGCAMGCVFCASGKNGLHRNLTPGEILAQVHSVINDIGEQVSNITLMGSGEPLDNFENTLKFIHLITSPDTLNIAARRLTLSTVGLTDKIYRLAEEKLQINLAVSLHAPNDRVRAEFLPVTRAFALDKLLAACKHYGDTTKRRITFEYAMIAGKNDRTDQAAELAGKLRNMLCHVNLIPINNAIGTRNKYKPSANQSITAFRDTLIKNGIETTIRRTLGSDINAACGELVSHRNIQNPDKSHEK